MASHSKLTDIDTVIVAVTTESRAPFSISIWSDLFWNLFVGGFVSGFNWIFIGFRLAFSHK